MTRPVYIWEQIIGNLLRLLGEQRTAERSASTN